MGWLSSDHPDHEGYAVGLVQREGTNSGQLFRELSYPDDVARTDVVRIQAACDCGWRSPYLVPARAALRGPGVDGEPYEIPVPSYSPHSMFVAESDEERCRQLWREHTGAAAEGLAPPRPKRGGREKNELDRLIEEGEEEIYAALVELERKATQARVHFRKYRSLPPGRLGDLVTTAERASSARARLNLPYHEQATRGRVKVEREEDEGLVGCDGCGELFPEREQFTLPEYEGRAWCSETCYAMNPPE